MKKTMIILLVIIGAILLGWFLYPKKAGYVDTGNYVDGAEVTSQTSSCFGYSYTKVTDNSDIFNIYCVGIPYNKKYIINIFGKNDSKE